MGSWDETLISVHVARVEEVRVRVADYQRALAQVREAGVTATKIADRALLDRLSGVVERFAGGCVLLQAREAHKPDEYVVLAFRLHDRTYITWHVWLSNDGERDLMEWGHYDMTIERAVEDFAERL